MKKPSKAAIRGTLPLSRRPERGSDPVAYCNLCGLPSANLAIYREHDEHDQPLGDVRGYIYIAKDHPVCQREMELHPRLYAEVMGDPGTFPLCGDCTHREAFRCRHPSLKANGGPGLQVILTDPFPGAICIRTRAGNMADGRMRRARECTGKAPR